MHTPSQFHYRCSILVPVFNEGQVFLDWLPKLLAVAEQIQARVVVVDDGSHVAVRDGMTNDQETMTKDVVFLRHDVNCGVGAALGTGLSYIKMNGGGVVMTIDGDGQHNPDDLKTLFSSYSYFMGSFERSNSPIFQFSKPATSHGPSFQKGQGVIINGSRFLKRQSIPWFRRLVNKVANVIAFGLSGFWVTDSQSGMKLFSPEVVQDLQLETPGYEWCLDVMREARYHGWSIYEIPVYVLYNTYSLNKGQHFAVGLDMVFKLIMRTLSRPFRHYS